MSWKHIWSLILGINPSSTTYFKPLKPSVYLFLQWEEWPDIMAHACDTWKVEVEALLWVQKQPGLHNGPFRATRPQKQQENKTKWACKQNKWWRWNSHVVFVMTPWVIVVFRRWQVSITYHMLLIQLIYFHGLTLALLPKPYGWVLNLPRFSGTSLCCRHHGNHPRMAYSRNLCTRNGDGVVSSYRHKDHAALFIVITNTWADYFNVLVTF